jgi:hypothetical protein
MPKRTTFFVPAILVFLPAAVLLTVQTSFAQHATDDCITKPNSAPPQGGHWYFRVDRMVHRQCWYLGPGGAKVRADTRQAESPMRLPPPRPISPSTAESLAGSTATKALPTQIMSAKSDADANAIMRSLGPSVGTKVSEPASVSNSAAMSYAEERTANSRDDMPLIWPVLPDDLKAAGPQLADAGEREVMLAILAGTFAFATVMFRLTFKRPAVGRSSLLADQRSVANARRPRERILPVSPTSPQLRAWPTSFAIRTGQRTETASLVRRGDQETRIMPSKKG